MVFSSPIFLFIFLPIVFLVLLLLKKEFRNIFLLFASLFFYAWGEGYLVLIMLISICINYTIGLFLDVFEKEDNSLNSKIILGIGIALNLGVLVYYKYFNFLTSNLQALGFAPNIKNEAIHLPIGISFFTFQSISYLIDVYRKTVKAQHNLLDLGLYISLFPQLVAGPIVRYHDIAEQIKKRYLTHKKFADGAVRFIRGLGKKVIIANTLAIIADSTFAVPAAELPTVVAWIGIVCYTLQIYYDFSGYSDMAIGLGKMMGFTFMENFNYPYVSKSIQEFWRRWHISLSTWFRDYLYIPLGGNRNGSFNTYRNLIIVFLITGLWHGASWNFVVWGLFHGLFLILERLGLNKILSHTPRILQHLYLLMIVIIGWVFFRAVDMEYAINYIGRMFSFTSEGSYIPLMYLNNYTILILIIGILFSAPIRRYFYFDVRKRFMGNKYIGYTYNSFTYITSLLLFIYCTMELAQNLYNPFIYFRF